MDQQIPPLLADPTPEDIKEIRKRVLIFGIIASVILVAGWCVATYLARANYDKVSAEAQKAQQEIEALKQKRSEQETSPDGLTGVVREYSSIKLGISFQYLSDQGEPIVEEGNKIYVGGKTGQSVEVFSKSPSDDFSTAIKKDFLENISDKDCWVEVYPARSGFVGGKEYTESYQMAQITYPEVGNLEALATTECPKEYQATNGVSYFFYDKNFSSKYFFFSIGQYAILAEPGAPSEGSKTWQDTFTINKLQEPEAKLINSYESCIAAGNAIIKTKPPKCQSAEGLVFVEWTGSCIQVIASARNPQTGETREFPTPCDVPEGWQET